MEPAATGPSFELALQSRTYELAVLRFDKHQGVQEDVSVPVSVSEILDRLPEILALGDLVEVHIWNHSPLAVER